MIVTLTNNIGQEFYNECYEQIHCFQSQKNYIRREINIKNNIKKIKEIKENIERLCSIQSESFVKYYDRFIDIKNNNIVLIIEDNFRLNGDDLIFTGINDILNNFEKICKGLKEYHDKNISHGNINIKNISNIVTNNRNNIRLGEINYDQLIRDNIVDKKKDIWDLGIFLFDMYCCMKTINMEYSKDILDKVITDSDLKLLITSILREKKEDLPEIKDILDVYLPRCYESNKRNESIKNENSANNYSPIDDKFNFDIIFDNDFVQNFEKEIGQKEGNQYEDKLYDEKEKETISEKNDSNKEFEKEKNECPKKEEKEQEQEGDKMPLEAFEEEKIIQEEMEVKKGPSLGLIEEDENEEFDSDIKEMKKGKRGKAQDSLKPFKNKNRIKDKEKEETLNEFIKEAIKIDNNKNFKKCLVVEPKKYTNFHKKLNIPLDYETIFEPMTHYKSGMNIMAYENILIDEKMKFTEQILNMPFCPCVCLNCSYMLCTTVKLKKISPLLKAFKSVNKLEKHIRRDKNHMPFKAIINPSFDKEWTLLNLKEKGVYHFIKTYRINPRTIVRVQNIK